MENNWIVKPMLLANGLNLFIMEIKKGNHLNIFIQRKEIIMKISQVLKDICQQHQLKAIHYQINHLCFYQ